MPVSPASIQPGKSYLVEPGSRIYQVVAITPDGKVTYRTQSATDGGGVSTSLTSISRERFARDVVQEVSK